MTLIQSSLIVKAPLFVLFSVVLCINSYTFAAITQIDKLYFGGIVVLDNNTKSEITVDTQGRIITTNQIRVIDLGHPAHYLLTHYAAYTQLFTVASVLVAETASYNNNSQQFTLIDVTTAPSLTTNAMGVADVIIGGTMQTSGSGINKYYDGTYTATIQLTVNY